MILCRQFVSIFNVKCIVSFGSFIIVFSLLKKGFGYETIRCLIEMKTKPCCFLSEMLSTDSYRFETLFKVA